MATRHDRSKSWIAAWSSREKITYGIARDDAPGSFAPLNEQIAGLAIKVSQCQSADSTFRRGAYLSKFHERLPQPFAIDLGNQGFVRT